MFRFLDWAVGGKAGGSLREIVVGETRNVEIFDPTTLQKGQAFAKETQSGFMETQVDFMVCQESLGKCVPQQEASLFENPNHRPMANGTQRVVFPIQMPRIRKSWCLGP